MKHVSIDTSLMKKSDESTIKTDKEIFLSKSPESSTNSADSSSPYLSSYNSVSTPHLLYSYPRSPYTEDKEDGGGGSSGNKGQN